MPPGQDAICSGGKRCGAGDGPARVLVYLVAIGVGVQTKPRPQSTGCGRGESRDAGYEPAQNRVYRSVLSCQAKSPGPPATRIAAAARRQAGSWPRCRHARRKQTGGTEPPPRAAGANAMRVTRTHRRIDPNARAGGRKRKAAGTGRRLSRWLAVWCRLPNRHLFNCRGRAAAVPGGLVTGL